MYSGNSSLENSAVTKNETLFSREAVQVTRARYNRLAPIYDATQIFSEWLAFDRWRKKLWREVKGPRILEIGVGTGKNMPYYPADAQVTAIDLSDRMLEHARRRAHRLNLNVDLREMDAQSLEFPDDSFDSVLATFVFCSIPDPVQGLKEAGRVVKPEGKIILLEHMRVDQPIVGKLMDLVNPLVVRLMGANINRRTVENVRRAELQVESVQNLSQGGMFKLIAAIAPSGAGRKDGRILTEFRPYLNSYFTYCR